MAIAVMRPGSTFPGGTSVGAYLERFRSPSGGAPTGTVAETATVDSSGVLAFTALAPAQNYVAYALVSGEHRYVNFSSGTDTGDDPVTESELEWIDVRDYMAVWDSITTDNTDAVNAALNAAVVAVAGVSAGNDYAGQVVLTPAGRGKVLGAVEVPANVHLRSSGPSGSYFYRPAGSSPDPVIKVAGVQNLLSDFGVICNDTDVDCIDLSGSSGASILGDARVVVRDVVVVGGRDGVTTNGGSNGNEVRLSRVTSQRAYRHGFNIPTTDGFIEGCTAAASGTGSAALDNNGFYIRGANTRIYGCKAYGTLGTGGAGFQLAGAGRHQVSACEAQDCEGDGFNLAGNDLIVLSSCTADSVKRLGFRVSSDDALARISACHVVLRGGGLYTPRGALSVENATGNTIDIQIDGAIPAFDNFSSGRHGNQITINQGGPNGEQSLAFAATVTPDPYLGAQVYVGTLTAPVTVAAPAGTWSTAGQNLYPFGQRLALIFTQDATGRAVTFNAIYKASAAVPTTASSVTRVDFAFDGTNWREVSRATT